MIKYVSLLLLLLIACNKPETNKVTHDFDVLIKEFNSYNPLWKKAIQDNQVDYIVDRYNESAIIGAPGSPFKIGKPAIKNHWLQTANVLDDFSYQTQYIGGDPETVIFENGLAFSTFTIDGNQVTDTSKYLFVWEYIGDGKYQVLSEMFNSL